MMGPLPLVWASTLSLNRDTPIKVLAVVGAAVLGGLLLGLAVQLVVKALTAQRLPYWALQATRLGGAVVTGWIVALILFGSGGGGWGGPGGGWFGGGKDRGKGTGEPTPPKDKKEKPVEAGEKEKYGDGKKIVIEVFNENGTGPKAEDEGRYYWIQRGPPLPVEQVRAELKTLEQVKAVLVELRKADPPLETVQVKMTRYRDSATPGTKRVRDLRKAAADLGLQVDDVVRKKKGKDKDEP